MADNEKIPQEEELKNNLGKIAYTLDKEYFSRIKEDYFVLPYDEYYNSELTEDENGNTERVEINTYVSNVRALKIKSITHDKEENFVDCLQNALSVFSNTGNTVAFVFNRFKDRTEIYAVVRNDGQGKNEESKNNISLFCDSLQGNFNGSEFEIIFEQHDGKDTKKVFSDRDVLFEDKIASIASVCGIPSAKSEEYLSQNIEKLFNGIVPTGDDDWYSVIIFAESLTPETIHTIREGLEEMATSIYPFQQHQFQMGENKAESTGEMKSLAHSDSTSVAITKTHSVNVGINGSRFSSASVGIALKAISLGFAKGKSVGASLGYGYSWGKTTTKGTVDTETTGTNNSITLGENTSNTYSYQSFTVKNLVERIEKNIERVKIGEGIGFWKYATYICAPNNKVSLNVANYIRSLTQGSESYMEPSVIREWHKENKNGLTDFDEIKKYVLNFSHPVFVNKRDGVPVNFSANVNTFELANIMSLPQHSIQGVPVYEGVRFGREPHALQPITEDLVIGCGYNMHHEVKNTKISLSRKELTKHTFITGSTGAGKSNTVYKILDSLKKQGVHFLVVEPAKGEYKDILGGEGVVTYGTNPILSDSELLRINPFRFPKSVHVLEHMDRLVEIFNACWPMYAAMPAILKDSIERAYVAAGWDLEKSENVYDSELFPSFGDIVVQIKRVLSESDYSDDNKGDYTGSLVTRLKSLTNGINGLIFTNDDLNDEELFDENVIVDLSRVGSTETKALIMGLIVLKLQEHRMDKRAKENGNKHDDDLKHITVLEEAHNLLRRTSTEQPTEGSNLLGKSVEMIANSIAEMRTYGEGFIIADQSPGLMDMSVIRNTNTKIIMRLPDYSDRELVGRAAGLSDSQIVEVSRFERGVAAITQSDWLEPVLCMVDKYEESNQLQTNSKKKRRNKRRKYNAEIKESLLDCIMYREIYRKGDQVDLFKIKKDVLASNLSAEVKRTFMEYLRTNSKESIPLLRQLVYDFLDAGNAIDRSKKYDNIDEWVHAVVDELKPSVKGYSDQQIDILLALIINEQAIRNIEYQGIFNRFTEVFMKEGRVF